MDEMVAKPHVCVCAFHIKWIHVDGATVSRSFDYYLQIHDSFACANVIMNYFVF